MALRLRRVSPEQWQWLAAARRAHALGPAPPRAEIGAIEIELRELTPSTRDARTGVPDRASRAS